MNIFWYRGNSEKIQNWTMVFATQNIIKDDFKASVNIIGYSHHISIENTKGEVLNEILATIVPDNIKLLSQKISIESNLNLKQPEYEIYTTPYNLGEIQKFLEAENIIKFSFEKGSWTVINWNITKNKIYFSTLHTYKELQLNLWTKSHYKI